MLASLLPGLRDLRAPLAAGYLWLLFGWLLLHNTFEDMDQNSGPLGAVIELAHNASPAGVVIAISFLAYLVGCLSQAVFSPAVERYAPDVSLLWRRARSGEPESEWQDMVLSPAFQFYGFAMTTMMRWWAFPEREKLNNLLAAEGMGRALDEIGEVQAMTLAVHVYDEVDTIADGLLDEKSDLFGPIDRMRGEIEFRTGIFFPLMGLTILLAIESSLFWVCSVVLPVILALDAARLVSRRNARIVGALTRKPALSPTIARIEESLTATEATSPDTPTQAVSTSSARKRASRQGTRSPTS
jgi:hypothetical protein